MPFIPAAELLGIQNNKEMKIFFSLWIRLENSLVR
jgi:hypothetical protein